MNLYKVMVSDGSIRYISESDFFDWLMDDEPSDIFAEIRLIEVIEGCDDVL